MVHSKMGEIEAEVVKIKSLTGEMKVVRFIKDTGAYQLILQSDEPSSITKGTRVIFRNADTTLGFGVIM